MHTHENSHYISRVTHVQHIHVLVECVYTYIHNCIVTLYIHKRTCQVYQFTSIKIIVTITLGVIGGCLVGVSKCPYTSMHTRVDAGPGRQRSPALDHVENPKIKRTEHVLYA